ncbi:MAG TPA: pitrilysin family protein [Burkholderiales bacterium]|nr:pitrilysin family protein [Burkholderiales bacterium]
MANKLVFGLILCLFTSIADAGLPIQHWQTASGARVLFVENHEMPMVDFKVEFDAGSGRDTKEKSGLAGMTRHLMPLGAGNLTEDQVSASFADIGAEFGGDFDRDIAAFTLRTLSSRKEKAIDLLAQILDSPRFDEKILDREKKRGIARIRDEETDPEHVAEKAFYAALYGSHPYAFPPEGEIDTVKTLSRSDVVDFYATHYTAGREVIAIVGDLTRDEAEAAASELSEGLSPDKPLADLPGVAYPASAVVKKIANPSSQSHILIGYPGITWDDPDYFPLVVGNYVLGGGGFESRLLNEVREKRGLAYSVYSYFFPLKEMGPFKVGLQTRGDQTKEALKVVRRTMDDFLLKGPAERELEAAKENIVGGFPLRLDSNKKILGYLGMIGFYDLPLTYLDDYTKKVEAVTVAQVRDAFHRRIKPEDMVTVIVGGGG